MTTRQWTLAAGVLFAAYAATIAGANWATTLWPAVTVAGLHIPAGALLAGLAFTVRDLLQDAVGTRTTLLAIALGAALSGLVAEPRIALASATAFAVSELVDLAAYTPLRDRSHLAAAGLSNAVGLLVDSLLFLPPAFGSLTSSPAKSSGRPSPPSWRSPCSLVSALAGGRYRREVLPRPTNPPG